MNTMEMMSRIQELTGAEAVAEPTRVSENVWSVRVAYADGPTASRFDVKLFDCRDGQIHIWSF
jgi:hypothetical protein